MKKYLVPYNYYKFWFLLFFVGMGLVVPQVGPFVFSELGIAAPGIIFLFGQFAMPLGSFLTGYISDKTLKIRLPVVSMSIIAGVSTLFFSGVGHGDVFYAGLFFSLFMFATGGILSLMNVSYLQNGFESNLFGRVRLFGTLGFALSNAVLMFVKITPSAAIKISSGFFIMSTFALYLLPPGRDIAFHVHEQISWARIRRLSTSPLFLLFIIVMLLFYFSFSAAEYLVSDYIKTFTFPVEPVPFAWLIGTLVEIVLFFLSPFLLKKYGAIFLIGLSFAAGAVRLFLLTFVTSEAIVLFSQGLHGIQFSGAYLGALIYLKEKAHPQRLGSAQALYTTYSRCLGTGSGAFLLGNIAGSGNFPLAFEIAAWASVAGLFLLVWFFRVSKHHRYFSDQ